MATYKVALILDDLAGICHTMRFVEIYLYLQKNLW